MSKNNQEWLRDDLKRLEEKVDKITDTTIPALLVEVAKITTQGKVEAKHSAKIQGWIYGGLALTISLTSLAVAYFKN